MNRPLLRSRGGRPLTACRAPVRDPTLLRFSARPSGPPFKKGALPVRGRAPWQSARQALHLHLPPAGGRLSLDHRRGAPACGPKLHHDHTASVRPGAGPASPVGRSGPESRRKPASGLQEEPVYGRHVEARDAPRLAAKCRGRHHRDLFWTKEWSRTGLIAAVRHLRWPWPALGEQDLGQPEGQFDCGRSRWLGTVQGIMHV